MQQITVIGNLSKNPEARLTQSGKPLCSFPVAVNGRFPIIGERPTTYYRVNVFGAQIDACAKYLEKGKKVAVVGELTARTYEGNDGKTYMSLDITASEVEFLTPKGAATPSADNEPTVDENGFTNLTDEDLPF